MKTNELSGLTQSAPALGYNDQSFACSVACYVESEEDGAMHAEPTLVCQVEGTLAWGRQGHCWSCKRGRKNATSSYPITWRSYVLQPFSTGKNFFSF